MSNEAIEHKLSLLFFIKFIKKGFDLLLFDFLFNLNTCFLTINKLRINY